MRTACRTPARAAVRAVLSVSIAARVLGTIANFAIDGRRVERVEIASDDLARRIIRLRASVGELGLRFESGAALRDGDVVFADSERVIYVDVAVDELLVAKPQTLEAAARLGHALGNRHLPVQFEGRELVLRYDRLVEALLRESGVVFARVRRKVAAPFRHAHAPHGHDDGFS